MDRMTSNWPLTLKLSKLPYIPYVLTPEAQILVRFVLRSALFEIQGCRKWGKSECTEWPQKWICKLSSQKYPVCTKYLALIPKFCSVSHNAKLFFEIQGCQKSEKWECTGWLQNEPEPLTVKSTLYTLSTYPQGPSFAPFHSASCFDNIALFIIPHWLPYYTPKKRKKMPKIQNWNFTNF